MSDPHRNASAARPWRLHPHPDTAARWCGAPARTLALFARRRLANCRSWLFRSIVRSAHTGGRRKPEPRHAAWWSARRSFAGDSMNVYLWLLAVATLLVGVGCSVFKAGGGEDYDRGQAPAPQFAKDSEVCAKQAEADQKQ